MPRATSQYKKIDDCDAKHAEVSWCAIDIQELRPDWTVAQCNEFLMDNEDEIQGGMIQRGWDVISDLLPREE